ncbi:hypothetical protein M885DRAFT_538083, partial [Pelagophyceae sp. CCMP2097]
PTTPPLGSFRCEDFSVYAETPPRRCPAALRHAALARVGATTSSPTADLKTLEDPSAASSLDGPPTADPKTLEGPSAASSSLERSVCPIESKPPSSTSRTLAHDLCAALFKPENALLRNPLL